MSFSRPLASARHRPYQKTARRQLALLVPLLTLTLTECTKRPCALLALVVHVQMLASRVHATSFAFKARSPLQYRQRVSKMVCSASAPASLQAFTIVGGGRIGQAIANMGPGNDVVVGRGEAVRGPPGPILVCTRNDDLQAVVDMTPPERRKDLVFLQNGMLEPWLSGRGLQDNTQVLVYFAVAKKGDTPIDGKTDVNPEGLTAAWGPHAEAVAERLHAGGLSCKVLGRDVFRLAMLEKLVWISAFMLMGVRHGGISVGQVEQQYGSTEISDLVSELCTAGAAELGVQLAGGEVERLRAYARSVAHYPTAIKEFPWRNGWFYGLTARALAEGRPDPCPHHTALLREVGAV